MRAKQAVKNMADPTPSVILRMTQNIANIHPELICGEDMNL